MWFGKSLIEALKWTVLILTTRGGNNICKYLFIYLYDLDILLHPLLYIYIYIFFKAQISTAGCSSKSAFSLLKEGAV